MTTELKPVGNRIAVRLDAAEQTTATGLIIPDIAQQKTETGIVEAVGPGRLMPLTVGEVTQQVYQSVFDQGIALGDRVLLTSAYAGAESGEPGLILVDLSEVLAVIP